MTTMNVSLVRDLIRRDSDRLALRRLVLDGLASPDAGELDDAYLEHLRARARQHAAERA